MKTITTIILFVFLWATPAAGAGQAEHTTFTNLTHFAFSLTANYAAIKLCEAGVKRSSMDFYLEHKRLTRSLCEVGAGVATYFVTVFEKKSNPGFKADDRNADLLGFGISLVLVEF